MRRRDFIALLAVSSLAVPAKAQGRTKRIALVAASLPRGEVRAHPYYKSFIDELARLGFVEGRNLVIDVYSGEGEKAAYPILAARVIATGPDAVMTTAGLSIEFKAVTSAIPIVAVVADPISVGLTTSLAKPDGNLTGVTVDGGLEINGKRIGLLIESRPAISHVGYLTSSRAWRSGYSGVMQELARRANVALTGIELGNVVNQDAYVAALRQIDRKGIDALLFSDEPDHVVHGKALVGLVEHTKLPAMYPFRDIVVAGGLMAYSVDLPAAYRYAAGQMAEILHGAKPAEIPFYQPTKFQFVVNTKAARAIGLDLPTSLLARADEVIE
jgi:putative ABC transport system substrate-binding protein